MNARPAARPDDPRDLPAGHGRGVSRRCAIGALGLGAAGTGLLAGCGPADEGFGNASPVRASDDAIPLSHLPENQTTLVNFGGEQPYVAVVRGAGDDISAMSGYCTHQGCAVAADGDELDCPCHGSRFDAKTGDVLVGPASTPLPAVKIAVEGDTLRRIR